MTTHSVFLVDDELLIVEGLRASIEKGMPGFSCIGTALSGEEALEKVLKLKPEIIISDIRMGEMSGIELARNLRQLLPFSKVILLSGYDDFHYAQSAIRNQVFDYLLKPITDNLLYQILQRAANALTDQMQERCRLAEITTYMDNSKPFLRHLLFSELRAPVALSESPIVRLFGIEENEVYIPVYIRFLQSVDLELSYESDRQYVLFEQVQYILEDMGIRVIPFFERVAFVLLLRFSQDEDALVCESKAYLALEKIASMIMLNREGLFCIGVGPLIQDIRDIRNAHEKAKEASRYYFHFGSGSIVNYNDIALSSADEYEGDAQIQQVILAIRAGAQETAQNLLHEYTNAINKRDNVISSIRHRYLHIYLTLWQEFGEACLSSQTPEEYLNAAISSLFSCQDIYALDDLLSEFIEQINLALSGRLLSRNQQIVHRIEEIIDREYATATLETISSLVHLSPAYTSNLFSNTCGITIREYIITKRIERSKILLKETDMKLYEIASAVGYSDPKYFSQLFRKFTGQTPNQYRYR